MVLEHVEHIEFLLLLLLKRLVVGGEEWLLGLALWLAWLARLLSGWRLRSSLVAVLIVRDLLLGRALVDDHEVILINIIIDVVFVLKSQHFEIVQDLGVV